MADLPKFIAEQVDGLQKELRATAQSRPLPVLQGHWRLLEPEEIIQDGDEYPDVDAVAGELTWLSVKKRIGDPVRWFIVRRRVSPTPKCETCPEFRNNVCLHSSGPCGVPKDGSGYCHLHPQAQVARG